jgi:drug/metabolite transporter (DMT)-like permease
MFRRSYQPVDYLLLLALSAIWGSSFLFIKISVATIPPMTLTAARLILAALGLLPFLWATGRRLPREARIWWDFSVVAFIGNLVPFFLIGWGETTIDSGLAAILMATMPLASVVLAHAFTKDDRLTLGKVLGMLAGFSGIVVLVGPYALAGLGREVAAQLAVAVAASLYAVTNVYTRNSRLRDLHPVVNGSGVLLCAAVMSLPLSLALDRPWALKPSTDSLLALLVLAWLCTSLAYLILFRLISTTRVTFAALLNYLIPVFGVLWGAALLGEALRAEALGALGLILFGIALAQAKGKTKDDAPASEGP